MSRTSNEIWPLVHAERAALARDLASLQGEQWSTPSLCAGLVVREVVAHLTAGGSLSAIRWLAGVIRCRFDFDRQVAMRLAEQLGSSPAETLARFERVVHSTISPPLPVLALLGEVVVHGEDIRRPLGITRDHPPEAPGRTRSSSPMAACAGSGSRRPTARSAPGPARSSPAARWRW